MNEDWFLSTTGWTKQNRKRSTVSLFMRVPAYFNAVEDDSMWLYLHVLFLCVFFLLWSLLRYGEGKGKSWRERE